MNSESLLNLVVYLPAVGALVLAFMPREQRDVVKWAAFGISVLTFLASLGLLAQFNANDNAEYQAVTDFPWIGNPGGAAGAAAGALVSYKVGMDGISLVLILLTTLLSAIAILSSFDAIRERVKEYYVF